MKTKSSKIGYYVSILLFLALIGSLGMPMQTARAIFVPTVDNTDPLCSDITGSSGCGSMQRQTANSRPRAYYK